MGFTAPAPSVTVARTFRPESYGAVRDGKVITDAVMSVGSAVLTSASSPFTPGDVGKAICVPRAGLDVNQNILNTTIASYQSAGQVTLAAVSQKVVTTQPAWWGTDDTAAINSAISAATTAALTAGNAYCADVQFSLGNYCVFGSVNSNGAQAWGGTTKGKAVLPLPNIPTTLPKVTLRMLGSPDSAPVWDQSRTLASGVTLLSNLLGGFDATFGGSSVMGGPTTQQVGGVYSSNLMFVLDGITFLTPWNWLSCALDLQNVAMHQIGTVGFNGAVNPANFSAVPTGGGLAFRTSIYWNESRATVDRLFLMGYTYGLIPGGNVSVKDGFVVYCQHGVCPQAGGRGIHFDHLMTDGCTFHLSDTLAPSAVRVDIDHWDSERSGLTTYHLTNSSNFLQGHANFHALAEEQPLLNQTTLPKYTIENFSQAAGPAGPPTVPAASTALVNPYNRRGFVKVTGGTGVTITVDGQARVLTEWAPIAPQGSINLGAYSVAPTWLWYLI